jgi:hypothetical protein
MKFMLPALVTGALFVLAGCGSDSDTIEAEHPNMASKATCGSNDKAETGLQGQVPAALRASGFKGFNCNLELAGQSKGDGASWQTARFQNCLYHDTAASTVGRSHLGTVVLDVSNASAPKPTTYLTTTSMLDPWESLKVNERRQLLAAVHAVNGGLQANGSGGGGPQIDLYDISGNCLSPQLLSVTPVGTGADGGAKAPVPDGQTLIGHEGEFTPDGLTYWGSDIAHSLYYAIDITNTTKPKLLGTYLNTFGRVHGLSVSDDGNRAYFTSIGAGNPDPAVAPANGLIIADVSDIQSRKANPQVRVVGTVFWKDGATAQHTIPVKIGGKPYIIHVDEAGSGGNNSAGWTAACNANLPAWPFARIIDVSNEAAPKVVTKLMLEMHDPANCAKVLPDLAGLTSFTYGSHYCSVDDKTNATTLACGYFNSGIRVFDIRDVQRPKEIAYFNPPGVTVASPGSNHGANRGFVLGGPDWCSAQVHLDKAKGELWTTCQDNGFVALKFTNGVWPFR